MRRMLLTLCLLAIPAAVHAQAKKDPPPPLPKPTATLKYGDHERQVIDFWKAESDKPTPVLLFIHGGGWRGGDKSGVGAARIKKCLDAGISVAAINYRYTQQAQEAKVEPPVKAPLEDAARALQTIRSKAGEWNIDKKKIAATGGSAGGCSSLWLAFHDDLADPKSTDPIARESTRLYAAAVDGAQTTLDPTPLREWMPNYGYGAHAFGLASFQELIDNREKVLKWINEYSPMAHVSKDDPPIYLFYGGDAMPPKGDKPKDPTHSVLLGALLTEKLKANNVESALILTGAKEKKYTDSTSCLVDVLKK